MAVDIVRLYKHNLSTDPHLFRVVETVPSNPSEKPKIVAFATCVSRPPVFWVAFLFVLPDFQGGIGRKLFDWIASVVPKGSQISLTVDSAQPISNALYSQYGVVARTPLQNLRGVPDFSKLSFSLDSSLQSLDLEAVEFSDLNAALPHIKAIDSSVLNYDRSPDYPFYHSARPTIVLYKSTSSGSFQGYTFAKPGGYVGPVCVSDPKYFRSVVLDSLKRALEQGRAQSPTPDQVAVQIWLASGYNPELFADLVKVGMRIMGFPTILSWDGPGDEGYKLDLRRYGLFSPGAV